MTLHLGERYADGPIEPNEVDELLTAYLDGELQLEEGRKLELRLAKEVDLRVRLAQLRQAYDFLDDLPETPHDQRFTQSTIEHVIQSVKREPNSADSTAPVKHGVFSTKTWRLKFPVLLLVCGLVGTSLGFVARGVVIKDEINQLSLIANLNGLRDVDNVDVARELSQEKVVTRLLKERFAKKFVPNVPADDRKRPAWVENLTPVQKSEIYRNRESLKRLSEGELNQLRKVNADLLEGADTEELQETVRLVGLVMESLMPTERLALEGMPPEDRVAYLRELLNFSAAEYYFSTAITEDDSSAIKEWFEYAKYDMSSSFGGFPGLGPPGLPNAQSSRESTAALVNRFALLLLSPYGNRGGDERISGILESLFPDLSEEGEALLRGLSPTKQLLTIFGHLAPNRMGNDVQFIESYSRLPSQIREQFDLSDPSQIRPAIRPMMMQGGMRPPGR